MRGYVDAEETPFVVAKRELHSAARKYAGLYLARPFGADCDEAERELSAAALVYASEVNPPKKGKGSKR